MGGLANEKAVTRVPQRQRLTSMIWCCGQIVICGKTSVRVSRRSCATQAGQRRKEKDVESKRAWGATPPYMRVSSAWYVVAMMDSWGTASALASASSESPDGTINIEVLFAVFSFMWQICVRVVPLPQ